MRFFKLYKIYNKKRQKEKGIIKYQDLHGNIAILEVANIERFLKWLKNIVCV